MISVRIQHLSKTTFLTLFVASFLIILLPMPVFATTNGAMGDFARSFAMQGNTDVYYSSPWLVKIVQWFISWTCIIALLAYYMSYLCSIVVLSNKELFYTIDALKRDKEGSSEGKKGIFGSVLQGFKNGASDAGLNGGADNIAVFILMLSLNFKAYSVYKNVEAGSDNSEGGKGPKYAYTDTMTSFFLKSLFDSIMVTFICSIALSGLLLGVWFTVGDVLIIKADRFAQTNLVAKLDQITGNDGLYPFTLAANKTKGGQIAENIARKIYANIIAQFPDITADQINAIGRAVEDSVFGGGSGASGEGVFQSVLGGDIRGYSQLTELVNVNLSDGSKIPEINSEEMAAGVTIQRFAVNTNPGTVNDTQLVYSLDKILDNAGVKPPRGELKLYAHITFMFNNATANNYLEEK